MKFFPFVSSFIDKALVIKAKELASGNLDVEGTVEYMGEMSSSWTRAAHESPERDLSCQVGLC